MVEPVTLAWIAVLAPLIGAGLCLLLGLFRTGRSENTSRFVSLAATALAFGASLILLTKSAGAILPRGAGGMLATDRVTAWLLVAIALSGLVAAVTAIAPRDSDPRHALRRQVPALTGALLLTQAGATFACLSLDAWLLVVGWMLAGMPQAFVAGNWGGFRRERAALRVGLSVATSSILLVTALAWVASAHHVHEAFSSDLRVLAARALERPWPDQGGFSASTPFLLLVAALALRFPIPPLHSWVHVAHEESPAPVSILSCAMLPIAAFAVLLRVGFGLFPRELAAFSNGLAIWASLAALHAALVAVAQRDLKRLIGMLAVSGFGVALYAALTRTPQGLDAALLLMLSTAVAASLAFVVATGLADRAGHRHLDGFGGIAARVPRLTLGLGLALLSLALLPATSGFPGLFLTVVAALPLHPGLTLCVLAVPLLASAAAVWTIQRIHLGPLDERYRTLKDATTRERVLLAVLVLAVLLLAFGSVLVTRGVHPLFVELAERVAFR